MTDAAAPASGHGRTTIAFDFGSTKIDVCRMDGNGAITAREQLPTAAFGPGEMAFLDRALALIVARVGAGDGKIGLSWNAPVHDGRLTQSTLLGGPVTVDLGARLRALFPDRDLQIESDVQAMALGEFCCGEGRALTPFVLVNLGSGAGFAYHDGRDVMRGHRGGAGLVSREPRRIDEINDTLTLDYLLSGRGVATLFERLTGQRLSAAEIAGIAATNDNAQRVFDILGTHLGHYLTTLARMFGPRGVLLAGSVTKSAPLFLPRAVALARAHLEPACQPETITVSRLEAPACRGLV